MKRVFISHPCSDNVPVRRAQNRELIERLRKENPDVLFISPLLLFDYFEEEDPKFRGEILDTCCAMMEFVCDEAWIFGDSQGCKIEREYAKKIGMPIKDFVPEREKGNI